MWAFFTEGTGKFAGWYVNLEQPHVRDERTVYTSDHVLDLVIAPDRTVTLKDQDELALAVAQGVFDASAAVGIEADAAVGSLGRRLARAVLRRLGGLPTRPCLADRRAASAMMTPWLPSS